MDLFEDTVIEHAPALQIKIRTNELPLDRALRRVKTTLEAGHPAVVAFSSGKDSSCLAAVVLSAARQLVAAGAKCPPIVVLHGNTGVEQPEMVDLAEQELAKMHAYAKEHKIPLQTRISHPSLADSFPVRVLGGRALPSFPDGNSDCSTSWKVLPNQRAQKQVFAELEGSGQWQAPVVMTGVRNAESIARDQKIAKRGEVAEGLWQNDFGAQRLSPLLDWTVDDVWEFIGMANAGIYDSYSDFAETMRIYRDGGGDTCVIVADLKSQGNSKPCGTRTGCWSCVRVGEDKSMKQMIESDPKRYGRLQPLAELRDFISNTQYDWSRRTFVGRTIDAEGYIAIGADTYSPAMLQDLLRYTLSAEVESGVPIISTEQLIGIDARWSQYAFAPPFTALKIWFEVMGGKLTFAPKVPRYPKTPTPKLGKILVGAPSYNAAMSGNVSGLRHVAMEMHHESCGFDLRTLNDGSLVVDVESDNEMTIDAQAAADFIEFIAEEKIEEYCREDCSDWTWGFKTYLQYGVLELYKGRSSQTHEILQRSQWRQAHNLHGQRSPEELELRCDVLFERQLELI